MYGVGDKLCGPIDSCWADDYIAAARCGALLLTRVIRW